MIVLDCETQDSTLNSLSSIYGIQAYLIKGFLQTFDLIEHYEAKYPPHYVDKELRFVFESSLNLYPATIDRVFWFHLTRVLPSADFSKGILPLSVTLDVVWETVTDVFRGSRHEDNLLEMLQNGVKNFHYNAKAHQQTHAGPYAMLIRDFAFCSEEVNYHDYLWLPEIMEDICNGYEATYGERLHDKLNKALVPKIIKFWRDNDCGVDCIEAALYFLWCRINNQSLSGFANLCFDGQNKAVPPSQITKVETIKA